jgi:hypothetical protein
VSPDQHGDKTHSHKLVKYPDDAAETPTGVTFRQRYVLVPLESLGDDVMLRPFEVESESFPHVVLSVTIERAS